MKKFIIVFTVIILLFLCGCNKELVVYGEEKIIDDNIELENTIQLEEKTEIKQSIKPKIKEEVPTIEPKKEIVLPETKKAIVEIPKEEPIVETPQENPVVIEESNSEQVEYEPEPEQEIQVEETYVYYSPSEFKYLGVLNYGGYHWTYYSQRVLPGGGLTIPGRHVDEDGYVCDENNYVCLASSDLAKGTIIYDTPIGKIGKIYDCGCASGVLDVYTDW